MNFANSLISNNYAVALSFGTLDTSGGELKMSASGKTPIDSACRVLSNNSPGTGVVDFPYISFAAFI